MRGTHENDVLKDQTKDGGIAGSVHEALHSAPCFIAAAIADPLRFLAEEVNTLPRDLLQPAFGEYGRTLPLVTKLQLRNPKGEAPAWFRHQARRARSGVARNYRLRDAEPRTGRGGWTMPSEFVIVPNVIQARSRGVIMTAKAPATATGKSSLYETDVIAWAEQQARLLRAGRLSELDVAHIAEEIEDVGKSEQRELASRMAVLLAHLIKWQYQPERRGGSWRRTIREQRQAVARRLRRTPSLARSLKDGDWWADAWGDAVSAAIAEANLEDLPERCPWTSEQVLDPDWLPASS